MKLNTIQDASFYQLFAKTNNTYLLHIKGEAARARYDKIVAILRGQTPPPTNITFDESYVVDSLWLSTSDKDFFSISGFDSSFHIRATSDQDITLTVYDTDANGHIVPTSLFCNSPKVLSCFKLHNPSKELVKTIFAPELIKLAEQLTYKEEEEARNRIIKKRKAEVLSGLKDNYYSPEEGVELFLQHTLM